MTRLLLLALLVSGAASALDPQTVTPVGTAARYAVTVQGSATGTPMPVTGSLSVSGTADLAGNSATYNANNVCSAVITAGEQSVGFHLTAGTLDATLTPYITNQTGAINCATAGTCTATTFSSGSTIVVTNPSGVKDVGVNLLGGVRQVQVCTTIWNSGTASGVVTATFVQAASSGSGGGAVTQSTSPWIVAGGGTAGTAATGVVTIQGIASMTPLLTTPAANSAVNVAQVAGSTTDTNSGTKSAGTMRVVLATDQPALTNKLLVTPDLPTGASTAAKQPALGTAGTASTDVITIQGVAAMTKLLVTPDSVALPANQSVNAAQLAGTTTDTNSGTKSAGTLRVVLATDQPALTNKLLVTPDSVALPANQSVNAAQLAGTTTDTNSGTKSAGTLRVVLATDQPALTNKLLVTPDSVALPANQSVNVAQVNGVTTLMGNGVTGTGSQRVTVASDNTAFTVNAAESGTWTVQPGNTANTTPWLASIHDGTTKAKVQAASTAAATTDPPLVVAQSPNPSPECTSFIAVNQTTGTTVITGTSSQKIYICAIALVSATAQNVSVIEGTGTVCASGTPIGILGGTTASIALAANGGLTMTDGRPWFKGRTAADNICIVQSGAGNVSGGIFYVSAP